MNNYYRPPSFSLFPPVVKNLIICNVLFLLATIVIQNTFNYDITSLLGLHYFESHNFKIFQLVTYQFLHDTSSFYQHSISSIQHILFNMFALWMFGAVLENFWGGKRFIIFYLVCGVGAALVQEVSLYFYFHHVNTVIDIYSQSPDADGFTYIFQNYFQDFNIHFNPSTPEERMTMLHKLYQFMVDSSNTIGASGAIFGVLLAFGMLFPNTLIYVFFAIPIKAKYFVIFYGLAELYSGIKDSTGDNVAHFAHLGGMLFGFLLITYWKRQRTI
jgi:membrane associated rhomboid family serine protease